MPQPDDKKERAPNPLMKELGKILPDVGRTSAVWVQRGITTHTYFNDVDPQKADVLEDGIIWDSITCHNGAKPTAEQVKTALRQLKTQPTTSDSSSMRIFEGDDPITAACNIAPRPRKGRTHGE